MFLVQAKEKDIAMSDTHSPSQASAHKHPTALLVTVCLAQLMVILDISIVNVALPAIHKGLHFSTTDLQWVVNAYTITFAGFLLLGGRASDLLGRRSVFIAGTAMFVIASLLCALANSRGPASPSSPPTSRRARSAAGHSAPGRPPVAPAAPSA
jgi:MFS family permease